MSMLISESRVMPTARSDRLHWLQEVGGNPTLLPPSRVALDLLTDSWSELGVPSRQELCDPIGSPEDRFRQLYGFPFVTSVFRGRFAEALLAAATVSPGSVVAGNALFPSTRFHIEHRRARFIDLSDSTRPHLADLDLSRQKALCRAEGRALACVWVEACCNALGGQPISLENLQQAQALCRSAGIPLILDATRLLDNVVLCQQRNHTLGDVDPGKLLREFCAAADACSLSASKDFAVGAGGFVATHSKALHVRLQDLVLAFGNGLEEPQRQRLADAMEGDAFERVIQRVQQVQWLHGQLAELGIPLLEPAGGHAVFVDPGRMLPHLSAEQFPAAALAVELYVAAGIRAGEHLSQDGRHLLRLAIPVGRYELGELSQVVDAFAQVQVRRRQIRGMRRKVSQPGLLGQLTAHFEPI